MDRNTKAKIKVRPMEPEDITGVLEIDHKIMGEKRAVTYQDLVAGDLGGELDLSYVAEAGDKVVGFIMARHAFFGAPPVEAGFIQIMGVDPDYQGQGIALELVRALLQHCSNKGPKLLRVMVNERDTQLGGFFAHVGFRRGQTIEYAMKL